MTKRRSLFVTVLSMIMVACLVVAACRKKPPPDDSSPGSVTTYTITWDVPSDATVTVEGYTSLPTTAEEDQDIFFTVSASAGYEVANVTVNRRRILASDGKYKATIVSDTAIAIVLTETITDVTVETLVTDMVYYAGESVDRTTLKVQAQYATGRTEEISDYTIAPAVFEGGETFFTVRYTAAYSFDIELARPVEYKVTIDPFGGEIAAGYIDELRANTELHDVTVGEDGVITFSYAEISQDVALPTAGQITKGEGDDFTFIGWTGYISAANKQSVIISANYLAKLVQVNSIRFEKSAGGDAQLIINVTFKAADTAYLYLYEGNKQIELLGPEVNGSRDEVTDIVFNLQDLADKGDDYIGAWMDIKFCAEFGERVETMEIDLNDYPANFVNIDSSVTAGGYVYTFAVWESGGRYLKVLFNEYKYEYDMTFGVSEGKDILTITGKVFDEEFYGKAVRIDFNSEATTALGAIDAAGNWTVVIAISELALNTTGYAHFAIVESVDDQTEIYRDGNDGNLQNAKWQTEQPTSIYGVNIITGAAIRAESVEGYIRVYYVGNGQWGGIVAYVRDETPAPINEVMTVVARDDKAYLVYSGDLSVSREATVAYLERHFAYVDIMEDTGWSKSVLAEDGNYYGVIITVAEEEVNGVYHFEVRISLDYVQVGYKYFFHAPTDSSNLTMAGTVDFNAKATAGGLDYRIIDRRSDGDGWKRNLVWVEAVEAGTVITDYSYTIDVFTADSLKLEDGRVYLYITGTVTGYTAEQIGMDIQNTSDWNREYPPATVTVENGRYTIKCDVTEASSNRHVVHVFFASTSVDTPFPEADPGEIVSVTLDGRTYSLQVIIMWGQTRRFLVIS